MTTQNPCPAAPASTGDPAIQTEARPQPRARKTNASSAANQRGAPANAFARRVAELRCAFVGAVLPEDLQQISRRLCTMAAMGDLAAAKLLLGYLLGKVPGAVDPDTLDQQECRQYQQNMSCTDIGEIVQHRPPADMAVGILQANEIANAERAHQFAQQIKEEDAQRESLETTRPTATASTEDLGEDRELTEHEPAEAADVPTDGKRVQRSRQRGRHRQSTAANGGVHDDQAGMPPIPVGDNGGSARKETIARPSADGSTVREPVRAAEAGRLANGGNGSDGGRATAAAPSALDPFGRADGTGS